MEQKLLPRFQVEKQEGVVEVDCIRYVPVELKNGKKGFEREWYKTERDAGWMVYTPRGDSFRVWTRDELKRLGLDGDPTMVDMETGDEQESVRLSLKDISRQKTSRNDARSKTAAVATAKS
jgi:hypothetical protein